MATLTATAAQANVSAKMHLKGVVSRVVSYSIGATANPNLSTGDVIQMLKVPSGCCILAVDVITDALTGGNYTINVGDGNSTGRYFASLSTGSTSAIFTAATTGFVASSIGYSYSTEDTIDIVVGTATTATAAGVLKLRVSYTMENSTVPGG